MAHRFDRCGLVQGVIPLKNHSEVKVLSTILVLAHERARKTAVQGWKSRLNLDT
jgi:hypothetical protein